MTIVEFQSFLGWCIIINFGVLMWWFLFLVFAHDWVYHLHHRWFKISEPRFDEIHYSAIAYYKLSVFVLMVVPYLALKIVL
ncbi:MAG: DUF6868 family protein [Cellvibrionaceae bacterium]